jgi:predicted metal-dependent hydrolase
MRIVDGGVMVLIPRWLPKDHPQVVQFVENGLKRLEGRTILNSKSIQISEERLLELVREWSARIGVQPGRIQMRQMYRKWGSCSKVGNITLNHALRCVPFHLAEYVVCHELVHIREFNHGKGFKTLMSQYMPDWQERDKELNKFIIVRPK